MLTAVGAGGGAPAAGGAAPAAAGGAAAADEEKPEEKKEEAKEECVLRSRCSGNAGADCVSLQVRRRHGLRSLRLNVSFTRPSSPRLPHRSHPPIWTPSHITPRTASVVKHVASELSPLLGLSTRVRACGVL